MNNIAPLNGTDATIYVKADASLLAIRQGLSQAVDGTIRENGIETEAFYVDVIENDDRARGSIDAVDEWLFYPYLVEIEWRDRSTSADEMVLCVTAVLQELDRIGADYVTAADFEDELPRRGRTVPIA